MSAWDLEDSPGMCNETQVRRDAPRLQRVRWSRLYGILVVMASALTSVDVFGPAGLTRAVLRGGIALAAFAGMALWMHANRAAFDYADWCDCAAEKITVRVIPSRQPERERSPLTEDELEPVAERAREAVLT